MCCEQNSPPVILTREAKFHVASPSPPAVEIARPVNPRRDPIVLWHRLDAPILGRLYALILAGIALGILFAAVRIAPSRDHLGTHRQLGLPPCGFLATTGFPCPTCGMTTAFAFLIRGQLGEALRSSVFGSALAVATAVAALIALNCAAVGRYPNLNWYRIDAVKLVYALALFLVLSWGFRIVFGLADGSLPAR
jgi:hypothetical protein